MQIRRLIIAAALAGFVATPALAQDELVDATNEYTLASILHGLGYPVEVETLDDGDPVIRSKLEGTEFSIFFYNCSSGMECKTVQFYAGYDLTDGMTVDQMNEWNRTKRFGKVYLDDESDPRLEMDVNLDFGVTRANFEDTIDWWFTIVRSFQEYIDW